MRKATGVTRRYFKQLPACDAIHAFFSINDEIKRWMNAGQIKLITLAPERPGALEAIRLCSKNGIIPVVGHSEAAYEQVIAAVDAGLSHATHTFNGMTGIHHRNRA